MRHLPEEESEQRHDGDSGGDTVLMLSSVIQHDLLHHPDLRFLIHRVTLIPTTYVIQWCVHEFFSYTQI